MARELIKNLAHHSLLVGIFSNAELWHRQLEKRTPQLPVNRSVKLF